MELANIDPAKLRPHEDVDPNILSNLLSIIRFKGKDFQLLPIIVDSNTLTVIDGHHRRATFMTLGLLEIPVLMVDYQVEVLSTGMWYLAVDPQVPWRAVETIIGKREGEICKEFLGGVICGGDIWQLLWSIEIIIQRLKQLGYKVEKVPYTTDHPMPSVTKEQVLYYSKIGKVFPPKTTRHVYRDHILHTYESMKSFTVK